MPPLVRVEDRRHHLIENLPSRRIPVQRTAQADPLEKDYLEKDARGLEHNLRHMFIKTPDFDILMVETEERRDGRPEESER